MAKIPFEKNLKRNTNINKKNKYPTKYIFQFYL